jgi:hypothetical protein
MDGATPYPADQWSDSIREDLGRTLEAIEGLEQDAAREVLRKRLHLPSGIWG